MKHIIALLVLTFLSITTARADDPIPLDRETAKRILHHMEWRDVNILAIRQGVDPKGVVAPIYVTIVGFGRRDAKDQQLNQGLIYDRELGWHLLEISDSLARIWTKDGYKEMKASGVWVRSVGQ